MAKMAALCIRALIVPALLLLPHSVPPGLAQVQRVASGKACLVVVEVPRGRGLQKSKASGQLYLVSSGKILKRLSPGMSRETKAGWSFGFDLAAIKACQRPVALSFALTCVGGTQNDAFANAVVEDLDGGRPTAKRSFKLTRGC